MGSKTRKREIADAFVLLIIPAMLMLLFFAAKEMEWGPVTPADWTTSEPGTFEYTIESVIAGVLQAVLGLLKGNGVLIITGVVLLAVVANIVRVMISRKE